MQISSLNKQSEGLSSRLLLLMSVATGLAVAGNYYAQPLLSTIAKDVGLSTAAATGIVTIAQLSYGAGLLLLVPLADLFERRRLIVVLMLLAAAGLATSAFATGHIGLLLGTAIAGVCSVVAQVLVPFTASLSAPEQRGRAVGFVMSGLLMGILLARVVAGSISSLFDWRTVYALAAAAMTICAAGLALALPRYQEDVSLGYGRLLLSVLELFAQEPVLRLRAVLGMLSFALFSLFWTPLAFLLKTPLYGFSDAAIGLLGLVGVAGALAANAAGRLADRGKGGIGTWIGLLGLLAAWIPLAFAQTSLLALLAGVLILDLAVQLVHVSNQNAIYALRPQARNRLNAGYMTCYFLGGAGGSWLATTIYPKAGWQGVVIAGMSLAALGIVLGIAKSQRLSDCGR
ncbi:MFS transporter [Pseudomonas nicosulfuronedens]